MHQNHPAPLLLLVGVIVTCLLPSPVGADEPVAQTTARGQPNEVAGISGAVDEGGIGLGFAVVDGVSTYGTVVAADVARGAVIGEIRYEGNDRTRERILDRALRIQVGDVVNAQAIEDSRQLIQDLALFKSVTARVEPAGDGSARVIFTVDEKHYWVAFPRFGSNSSGDTTIGIHSRFNNLFGLNHTMGLNIDQRNFDDPDLGTSNEFFGRYRVPGVDGTRIDLDFTAFVGQLDRIERDPLDVQTAVFDESTLELGAVVSRWLGDQPIGHGWRVGGGLHYRNRDNTVLSGALLRAPSIRQVGVSAEILFEDMHHHVWSDSGRSFGARWEVGVPGLSDSTHQVVELYADRIWQIGDREHHNLYLDGGIARTANIDASFVSYGFGRPSLRGALKSVREGDSYEYIRFGYLRPVFHNPALRLEMFIDAGRQQLSGYPDPEASNVGIGLGLRWRIRSFVKVEIALGLVYSPDTGELRAWGGSNGLD